MNSLQGKSRFKYFSKGIQLLSFDQRIGYHNLDNMEVAIEGSPFATAYFCKDVLPKDLIIETTTHTRDFSHELVVGY